MTESSSFRPRRSVELAGQLEEDDKVILLKVLAQVSL